MKSFNVNKALQDVGVKKVDINSFLSWNGTKSGPGFRIIPPNVFGVEPWDPDMWSVITSLRTPHAQGFDELCVMKGRHSWYPIQMYYHEDGRVGLPGLNLTDDFEYRYAEPDEMVAFIQGNYATKAVPVRMMKLLVRHMAE